MFLGTFLEEREWMLLIIGGIFQFDEGELGIWVLESIPDWVLYEIESDKKDLLEQKIFLSCLPITFVSFSKKYL